MNRLNEIEARANAATPGPWEAGCNDRHVLYVTTENEEFCAEYGPELYDSQGFFSDDDTEFIAHARTDVPALVSVARFALSQHAPDGYGNCGPCDDATGEDGWPCSTVREIHRLLGEDT